jgi:hypothetical protein
VPTRARMAVGHFLCGEGPPNDPIASSDPRNHVGMVGATRCAGNCGDTYVGNPLIQGACGDIVRARSQT